MSDELYEYFQNFSAAGPDRFAESFMSLDPRTVSILTRDQLRAALPMRQQMFSTMGVEALEIAEVDALDLDDQHVLARTTWTARMSRDTETPLEFKSTYLLRRHDTSWRVVVYLNHQELRTAVTGSGS